MDDVSNDMPFHGGFSNKPDADSSYFYLFIYLFIYCILTNYNLGFSCTLKIVKSVQKISNDIQVWKKEIHISIFQLLIFLPYPPKPIRNA